MSRPGGLGWTEPIFEVIPGTLQAYCGHTTGIYGPVTRAAAVNLGHFWSTESPCIHCLFDKNPLGAGDGNRTRVLNLGI